MRRHRRSIWSNAYLSLAAAALLGCAAMLAGAALLSALSYFVLRTAQFTELFAALSAGAGACFAGYVCGLYRRRRGLIEGALCGAVMFAALSAAAISVTGTPPGIKKLLLLTIAGSAGGVIGVNSKRPKNGAAI